jgi:hypothetical protein
MTNRISLLGGAALCALAVAAAPAQAATHKAVKHTAPAASTAQAEQIRQLQAQVQALTDRLNAQEASQQQVQAQAAQAQATAQAAQEQTDNQVENIPAQVNLAVAAIPKPKKTWAEDTSVNGRMYYDITNITQKTNGGRDAPPGTGFDVKRFYVGVDHKFNDVFSANITTDFNYVANDSETQVYVKKAYLQAKLNDALVIRVGSTDLPWVPFAEDLYGYRYVENTLIDRTKYGTSADWGVHASGKFGPNGMFNYAVAAIDGAGYKAPLRSKSVDFEGRVSAKVSDFTFGLGGYTGKLGKETQGVTTFHTAERVNAIAVYNKGPIRLGGEYFAAKNWNNVLTTAEDKSDGYSLFGSYALNDKFGLFGRYDRVKPNKDTKPSLKDDYFNVGLSYSPAKIVDFALVYKRDQADNGVISTSNGNIGGSSKGTYDEVGLWGQFRW